MHHPPVALWRESRLPVCVSRTEPHDIVLVRLLAASEFRVGFRVPEFHPDKIFLTDSRRSWNNLKPLFNISALYKGYLRYAVPWDSATDH